MLVRSLFVAIAITFSFVCMLCEAAQCIDATSQFLAMHTQRCTAVLHKTRGSSHDINDIGYNRIARVAALHSGDYTVRLHETLADDDAIKSLLKEQLYLSPAGWDQQSAVFFSNLIDNFYTHPYPPLLILPVKDKIMEHNRAARIGSTPHLLFGTNVPIFKSQKIINVTDCTSAVFRKSRLIEPIYLHIELQTKFTDSLASGLPRISPPKHTFKAVDYAVLVIGYVHDFRVWLDLGVIPSDAHQGNIFFQLSKDGDATFYWGEFGPASEPSDQDKSWTSAIECYNGTLRHVRTYLDRIGAFPNSDVVLDLIEMAQTKVLWQTHAYSQRHAASMFLLDLQISLVDRIVVSPDEVRIPFFNRMSTLAALPMTRLAFELASFKNQTAQKSHDTDLRLQEQSALISTLMQRLDDMNQQKDMKSNSNEKEDL